MLTRLSHQALQSPSSLETLSHSVAERIRAECPQVEWTASYAVLGPTDYLDIFKGARHRCGHQGRDHHPHVRPRLD